VGTVELGRVSVQPLTEQDLLTIQENLTQRRKVKIK
jgi:hypothetical protein